VQVNGEEQSGVRPGSYLALDRTWKRGDEVVLAFDLAPRLWVGERETAGKVAVYHGPLLLAYDPSFDNYDPRQLPAVDPRRAEPVDPKGAVVAPLVLLRFRTADGGTVTLCDFASAGAAGNRYVSWLPAREWKPVRFGRDNPLRAVWP
jgi:DUF1680 family protein